MSSSEMILARNGIALFSRKLRIISTKVFVIQKPLV